MMDMGNYSHEEEILLKEGTQFIVQSVDDDLDAQGKKVKLITLQCYYYSKGSIIGWLLTYYFIVYGKPYSNLK